MIVMILAHPKLQASKSFCSTFAVRWYHRYKIYFPNCFGKTIIDKLSQKFEKEKKYLHILNPLNLRIIMWCMFEYVLIISNVERPFDDEEYVTKWQCDKRTIRKMTIPI